MQENSVTDSGESSTARRLPSVIVAATVTLLTCVMMGAILVAAWPNSPLPTTVARAVLDEPPTRNTLLPPTLRPTEALVPQVGGRSAGDPYIPELGNTGYDVQHYTIQLAVDPAQPSISGATSIEALSTLPGLAQLSLDLVGFQVSAVTVDGIAANYSRDGKKLVVDLPVLLPDGEPFVVVVTYRGEPIQEPSPYLRFVDHLGLHYPDGESLFAIAEPDGARFWYPANDHPRDKATFRFEIVAPPGLTAVANGRLVDRRAGALPNGQIGELFVWEHLQPMAPYLAVVAVGRYERFDDVSPQGVPLRHYGFPELLDDMQQATATTGEALDWMGKLFGAYPFEAFGFVSARVPGGSMETQTMVLLSDRMIGQRTAIHELAHMWFGDWVSLDSWGEMWRNEGFATYVTILWETREDREDLELQIEAVRGTVEGNEKDYPLDDPPPEYLFEFNVYFEGALAVHALRQEMGDEAFFGGLRSYFQRFGGSTASDAQFRAVMEEAAGRSLDNYYEQWFP